MVRILNFVCPLYWKLWTPYSHILSTRMCDVEDFFGLQKSIFHIINLSISLQFIVNDLVLLGLKAN